jgi:hypothetical protein
MDLTAVKQGSHNPIYTGHIVSAFFPILISIPKAPQP